MLNSILKWYKQLQDRRGSKCITTCQIISIKAIGGLLIEVKHVLGFQMMMSGEHSNRIWMRIMMYTLTSMLARLDLQMRKYSKVLQNFSYSIYYSYSKATWKQEMLFLILCSENNIVPKLIHSSIFLSVYFQCFMYTVQIWLIPTLMVQRLWSHRYISIKSTCALLSLQFNGIWSHSNEPWMACIPHSAVCQHKSSSWNAMGSAICSRVPWICWPSFNGAWMCLPTSTISMEMLSLQQDNRAQEFVYAVLHRLDEQHVSHASCPEHLFMLQ